MSLFSSMRLRRTKGRSKRKRKKKADRFKIIQGIVSIA